MLKCGLFQNCGLSVTACEKKEKTEENAGGVLLRCPFLSWMSDDSEALKKLCLRMSSELLQCKLRSLCRREAEESWPPRGEFWKWLNIENCRQKSDHTLFVHSVVRPRIFSCERPHNKKAQCQEQHLLLKITFYSSHSFNRLSLSSLQSLLSSNGGCGA